MRDGLMLLIFSLAACSGSPMAPVSRGSEVRIEQPTTPGARDQPPALDRSVTVAHQQWVGTWATAQQRVEPNNEPPFPHLAGNTLRQTVRVSLGGKQMRLRLSNEYGSSALVLNEVRCADSRGDDAISSLTDKRVTFGGSASVTIPAKQFVYSDPLEFALAPLSDIAISIYFGSTPQAVTGHPGSRTTSYLQKGNQASAPKLSAPVGTEHWYAIAGIDVMADITAGAVVILGDSITDGRGSTTNRNDRWPDALARRLGADAGTGRIGVLNQGIGGNAVLTGGLGPTAVARFDQDVVGQSGVRWLIIIEGVNDIGASKDAGVVEQIIGAYEQFSNKAHLAKIKVYGVPILPFKGHSYYSTEHEAARNAVNDWIRTAGNFDAVIDLEKAVRDPLAPDLLRVAYDSGDHLHLNPTGYLAMANAVDLRLFAH